MPQTQHIKIEDMRMTALRSSVLLKEMLGEKPKATKQEKEEKVGEKAE